MGFAFDLARKGLRQRPARTVFSVLGIAVGIATVVGLYTLDHNTLLTRATSRDPDWRAEIEVSPAAVVEEPRQALQRVPGVTDVAAAFQSEGLLVWTQRGKEARASEPVSLIAIDAAGAAGLGALHLRSGRGLETRTDSGAPPLLVGEKLAERLELELGDQVALGRPARRARQECADGVWKTVEGEEEQPSRLFPFEVAGIMRNEGLGRRAGGEIVVLDFEVGRRVFEDAHLDVRYWLKHDPSVDLERIQSSLGQAWSYELKKSVIIGQAADERAFRNGVRFGGLLALVLGLYVIFHTLSMSLVERVREVGVLHALGSTRAQIARVFLCEALVIAGLGGACGLLGGLGLAWSLGRVGIGTIGVGERIGLLEVPWSVVLPLTAAGVVIALVGSIYPLARARSTDTVSALRGEESTGHGALRRSFQLTSAVLLALVLPGVYFGVVPIVGEAQRELVSVLLLAMGVLALFVAVPLVVPSLLAWLCVALAAPLARRWPLAGRLAASGMQRGTSRVAGAVAAVALVAAGYVGLRGMTRSLEGEISTWASSAYDDKLFVRSAPTRSRAELWPQLQRIPGVLAVEPNDVRAYVPFLLVGADLEQLARAGPAREEPAIVTEMRERKGLILSTRLAQHRGHALGDEVHVTTPRGNVVSLPVVAISDAYGYFPHPDERLYGLVDQRWMLELFCIGAVDTESYALRLARDADVPAVIEQLQALYSERALNIETGSEIRAWHTSDIARDFVLFDILIALVALLAGLGVLNGQLLAGLERSKELGILRALGMSTAQVAGTVAIEECTVGVVAGLLGGALGATLSPVIVKSLAVISGLPLSDAGPGWHLAWAFVGAVALSVLAGLYPIWRQRRASTLAAIRTGG